MKLERFQNIKVEWRKKKIDWRITCFTKVEILTFWFQPDRRAREIKREGKWVELVGELEGDPI